MSNEDEESELEENEEKYGEGTSRWILAKSRSWLVKLLDEERTFDFI